MVKLDDQAILAFRTMYDKIDNLNTVRTHFDLDILTAVKYSKEADLGRETPKRYDKHLMRKYGFSNFKDYELARELGIRTSIEFRIFLREKQNKKREKLAEFVRAAIKKSWKCWGGIQLLAKKLGTSRITVYMVSKGEELPQGELRERFLDVLNAPEELRKELAS